MLNTEIYVNLSLSSAARPPVLDSLAAEFLEHFVSKSDKNSTSCRTVLTCMERTQSPCRDSLYEILMKLLLALWGTVIS